MEKSLYEVKEGEQFRFTHDGERIVRTAVQVGRTEIYCPHQNSNPYDGESEVYLRSNIKVILLSAAT